MSHHRIVLFAIALVAALPACQGVEPPAPVASLESSPPIAATPREEPSTEEGQVLDTPSETQATYAQRVLQTLYDLQSAALREAVAEGALTEHAQLLLRQAYHPEQVDAIIQEFQVEAARGFPDVLPTPGRITVEITNVISASDSCMFLAGTRDYQEVFKEPRAQAGEVEFTQLLAAPPTEDDSENSTSWLIGGTVLRADGTQPENPCVR